WRKEIFKAGFDFKKEEEIELDPEKRSFLKNEAEQKEYWRLIFKQATLSRYLDLQEERNDLLNPPDDKKKDKKKKTQGKKIEITKTMTDKEIMEKSVKAIDEKYERVFTRML